MVQNQIGPTYVNKTTPIVHLPLPAILCLLRKVLVYVRFFTYILHSFVIELKTSR